MPLPKERIFTSDDYWNLPDGKRAELIDGQFYDMAQPSSTHQLLISQLMHKIGNYIESQKGSCLVFPAPFAVNLDADDRNWVEPDISVICDRNKITSSGCNGAPDLIIEVISPSSRKMDYIIKNTLYPESGVREYWIVDPAKKFTIVYCYQDEDFAPTLVPFDRPIQASIFEGLSITIADLLEHRQETPEAEALN